MNRHFLFDKFHIYKSLLRGDGYTSGDPRCTYSRMKSLFGQYIEDLKNDQSVSTSCAMMVEEVCSVILDSFVKHQKGLQSEAFELFYNKVFKELSKNKLRLDHRNQAPLYRMRSACHGEMFSKEEMFHIKYPLTHIVKTARYSTIGYPSLYLGNSLYICWEELRRTDFDSANVACFAIVKDCQLLDLSFTSTSDSEADAIRFPLCLACSLVTLHPEGDYKPEYVIPQLLMQSILTHNNHHPEDFIDGIRYTSRAVLTDANLYDPFDSEERWIFMNYVFPAVRKDEEDECISSHLMSLFKYTEAHTFEEYDNLYHYQTNDENSHRFGQKYSVSKFSRMEQYLDANIPSEAYGMLTKNM